MEEVDKAKAWSGARGELAALLEAAIEDYESRGTDEPYTADDLVRYVGQMIALTNEEGA